MDTELNSPPHDGGDSAAAFKKPSNDGSGRKYRRRALAGDGSSSSDGSPERDHIPNPKHSREDVRKVSEPVHARRESRRESDDRGRYGRGGVDSHRHDRHSRDDDHYRSKRDEYYRHERDAPRSSRDSRGDHRRAETEHSRLRNDSDRHSRDRAASGRRHADSRAEDKEKDYVKRGSRWTFGESRDEKELEDREINKEKDVHHAKSPRDRPDGATENRDTHSKKLKGFVAEKFTHGNTNAEEKHTSRFKPALGAGNQGLSLQSQSKDAEVSGDVDAAKVAAMQAAELVNKNLVGTGYLTTDQKKKLLWGKKKSTAAEEAAHRWDSALVGDRERQEKFNKLMGVKGSVVNQDQNPNEVQVEKQNELQKDLEKQYTAGLRRRDGRTVGLGL
ncbi:uncharacterized protein LOC108859027 isoform X1 [Raphanus sativus]|uniref:Uncharacterized protein LOC108859027 isoform X1 n=1 Tax=Raphanus sativus TaxID=3726 RepID=A0A9W3DQM8_RAPSA|nr:uncharacterized protein LOC108859027 isoform X1 [Raphanus sativus]